MHVFVALRLRLIALDNDDIETDIMPRDFPALPGFYQALFLYFEPCWSSPFSLYTCPQLTCHDSVNHLPCFPGMVLPWCGMVSRPAHPSEHPEGVAGCENNDGDMAARQLYDSYP